MAEIKAFLGIRYNRSLVEDLQKVTTPPYDIISKENQEKYYKMHPHNIIRLELGKESINDKEDDNKYTRAADYLKQWLDEKILIEETQPAIYINEQTFQDNNSNILKRTGFICLVKLEDFSQGTILPHEYTLSKPKEDRFNLMKATNCNFSQIFSLFNDDTGEIGTILYNATSQNNPDMELVTGENVKEKIWIIKDVDVINTICNQIKDKQLFIADGHHRYETALKFRDEMAENNPCHTGREPYNYVMMMLVDMNDPGMKIFPTHRLLSNLDNYCEEAVIEKACTYFTIEKIFMDNTKNANLIESKLKSKPNLCTFIYYPGKRPYFYRFILKDASIMTKKLPNRSEAYRNLDVTILHELILKGIMNINEDALAGQQNLNYTRDVSYALEQVHKEYCQAAFFINPPAIEEVKNVSLALDKMPQKSTYFYPKLLTGLIFNRLDKI